MGKHKTPLIRTNQSTDQREAWIPPFGLIYGGGGNSSMNLLELSGRPKNKFIQFALDLNKVKVDKLNWPQIISEKIDGVYCIAHKDPYFAQVRIYSRTGELYTSMRHIEEILYQIMEFNELIVFEACGPMGTVQATVSGWCRDTKEQHPELCAGCNDLITLKEFTKGGVISYKDRAAYLKNRITFFKKTKKQYWSVFFIDQKLVYSLEEAKRYAEDIWARDGQVIQISGMTDWQRACWWAYPPDIIGKIVQVDAMCESSKGLLREPRFKGIRQDKMEGDF